MFQDGLPTFGEDESAGSFIAFATPFEGSGENSDEEILINGDVEDEDGVMSRLEEMYYKSGKCEYSDYTGIAKYHCLDSTLE